MAQIGATVSIGKLPDFKGRADKMQAALLNVINEVGQLLTAEVAAESPYRTGRLRRSHRARIRSQVQCDVIGWTPYLEYVLYGTRRGIKPNNWPARGVRRGFNTVRNSIRNNAAVKQAVA